MDKNKVNEIENSGALDKGQSSLANFESLSFFKNNESCLYVHKKTSRLISALYLLTGLLSENEPLRTRLRTQGLDLISKSLFSSINFSVVSDKTRSEFTAGILEIISLLEIAQISHLISLMNHEVMVMEFRSLLQVIDEKYPASNSSTLQSDFFAIQEQLPVSAAPLNTLVGGFSQVAKSNINSGDNRSNFSSNAVIKDNSESNVLYKLPPKKIIKPFAKPNRSQQILALMKKDKLMTIKDFATYIKDCSEKTLQRELLSLVAIGTIRKEGERRWSRYSLI